MTWTLVSPLRRVRGPRPAAPAAPQAAGCGAGFRPGPHDPPPTLRDWIGVLAMVVGQFMAIMDVQIVTSSLTQIQGGLSASSDEISWVQTAYLIADVVMVPMSGTLSRMVSTRVVFCCAALGFTAASALCATATSLDQMIFYRAMQGFCGGAITPDRVPGRLHEVPRDAAGLVDGADLADPQPVIDPWAHGRRLPHRHLLLALAVPCQHRAGNFRRDRRVADHRHRQPRTLAAAQFRLRRARADGDLPRLPRIRTRGGAALGLASPTTRSSPPRSSRRSPACSSSGGC